MFTDRPLEGNAVAVFPNGSGIDGATMQRIAREFNLSETTFVLPPTRDDCVARVRIFTPTRELPFAGHPTLGTAFVLMEEGMVDSDTKAFVLEEDVGPVPVRVDDASLLWLRTPPISEGTRLDPDSCAQALGLEARDLLDVEPQLLSAGNPTLFVGLKNKEAVDRAWLDGNGHALLRTLESEPFCVFVFAPAAGGAYSRMFAPDYGIPEDPATGSSTGPLALFMMRHGLAPSADGTRLISEQGAKMGRRSLLHVRILGDQGENGIDVGGTVVPVAEGTMLL